MWTHDIVLIILKNWGFLLGFCAVLWAFCMLIKDASIIDRFWGPLCAMPSVFTLWQTGIYSLEALLLVALSVIWALRLSYHISTKNWNNGQDERYTEETSPALTRIGSSPFQTLVSVFFGQATLAWIISAPVQFGQFYSTPVESGDLLSTLTELNLFVWLGCGIWTIGFIVEMLGDLQLRVFKANPENNGKILDQGLWAWTRHPNYFGDSTVWFGLYFIALGTPLGIYSLFGPLVLYYFLTRMTGKDLTERVMLAKYPAYAEYIERTSAFFPLPPGRRET